MPKRTISYPEARRRQFEAIARWSGSDVFPEINVVGLRDGSRVLRSDIERIGGPPFYCGGCSKPLEPTPDLTIVFGTDENPLRLPLPSGGHVEARWEPLFLCGRCLPASPFRAVAASRHVIPGVARLVMIRGLVSYVTLFALIGLAGSLYAHGISDFINSVIDAINEAIATR